MTDFGRLMGVDFGEVRIGIALSDPLRIVATPFMILSGNTVENLLTEIKSVISDNGVCKIIIGLPTDANNQIGFQAAVVIRWAHQLAKKVDIPIVFWDESYSSVKAKDIQSRRKRNISGKNEPLDHIAAAAILQEYLEAGGNNDEPGQPIESFSHIE